MFGFIMPPLRASDPNAGEHYLAAKLKMYRLMEELINEFNLFLFDHLKQVRIFSLIR